jgi:hypothetical protein
MGVKLADTVFLPFREQQRSWLYRIRPSVTHEPFHPLNFPAEQLTADFSLGVVTPNQVSAYTPVAPMRCYLPKHIQCKQRVCLQEIAEQAASGCCNSITCTASCAPRCRHRSAGKCVHSVHCHVRWCTPFTFLRAALLAASAYILAQHDVLPSSARRSGQAIAVVAHGSMMQLSGEH